MKLNNNEIIKEYLTYLIIQKGYSANTIIRYEYVYKKYAEYTNLCESTILEADYKLVKNFVYQLHNMEYESTTISNYISSLKSLYRYLLDKGYVDINIMENIVYPKKDNRLFKIIYSKELKSFFKSIEDFSKYPKRDRVLFMILYTTGIRVFECSNLKIKNINFQDKVVKIYGKGKKERLIFLKDEVCQSLEEYIIGERNNLIKGLNHDFLFVNKNGHPITDRGIRYLTTSYCKQSSEYLMISPHTFRHTLATNLLNNGMNLRSIQIILGHESLVTTEKYTHLSKDDLRSQYERLISK